ncbi:hypothetical protein FCOIX_10818 [Fusarium coicis]|nr:hypothetical protein FCOIX_10818 [Fusarium coicis]
MVRSSIKSPPLAELMALHSSSFISQKLYTYLDSRRYHSTMDLDNTHEESVIVVATRALTPLQSFLALASPNTCQDDCTGLLNADTDENPPDNEFGEILCGSARKVQATSTGLDDGEAEKGNESEIDIQSERPAIHAAGLKNANDIESLTPELTQHDDMETSPGPSQSCINESLAQKLAPLRRAVANESDGDLEQVDQDHTKTDHSKLGDEPHTIPRVEAEEAPKECMMQDPGLVTSQQYQEPSVHSPVYYDITDGFEEHNLQPICPFIISQDDGDFIDQCCDYVQQYSLEGNSKEAIHGMIGSLRDDISCEPGWSDGSQWMNLIKDGSGERLKGSLRFALLAVGFARWNASQVQFLEETAGMKSKTAAQAVLNRLIRPSPKKNDPQLKAWERQRRNIGLTLTRGPDQITVLDSTGRTDYNEFRARLTSAELLDAAPPGVPGDDVLEKLIQNIQSASTFDEVLVSNANFRFRSDLLQRLRPGQWLHADIIVACLHLSDSLPHARVGISVPIHRTDDPSQPVPRPFEVAAKRISEWHSRCPGEPIVSFFPLLQHNNHFSLLEINETDQSIYHYDSSDTEVSNHIKQALFEEVDLEAFKDFKFKDILPAMITMESAKDKLLSEGTVCLEDSNLWQDISDMEKNKFPFGSEEGLDFCIQHVLSKPYIRYLAKCYFGQRCVLAHWLRYRAFPGHTICFRRGGHDAGRRRLIIHLFSKGSKVRYFLRSHLVALPTEETEFLFFEVPQAAIIDGGFEAKDVKNGEVVIFDGRLCIELQEGYVIALVLATEDVVGRWPPMKLTNFPGLAEKIQKDMESDDIGVNFEITEHES